MEKIRTRMPSGSKEHVSIRFAISCGAALGGALGMWEVDAQGNMPADKEDPLYVAYPMHKNNAFCFIVNGQHHFNTFLNREHHICVNRSPVGGKYVQLSRDLHTSHASAWRVKILMRECHGLLVTISISVFLSWRPLQAPQLIMTAYYGSKGIPNGSCASVAAAVIKLQQQPVAMIHLFGALTNGSRAW